MNHFLNSTETNGSRVSDDKLSLQPKGGSYLPSLVQIVADVLILTTNVFGVTILNRAKLIPYPVRILAINLLVSDGLSAVVLFIDGLVKTFVIAPHPFVVVLTNGSIKCLRLTSSLIVTFLSIERLLVLILWDTHVQMLNERKLRLSSFLTWMLGISCSVLIDAVFLKPTWLKKPCGKKCYATSIITDTGVKCRASVFAIALIVTIVCFVGMIKIARRSAPRVEPSATGYVNRITKSAVTSAFIIGAASIGNFHPTVVSFLQAFTDIKWGSGTQLVIFVSMHVSLLINPYVYVWRFKDARLQALRFFSFLPICRIRAEKLRYDVFNIVPAIKISDRKTTTVVA